VSLVDDGPDKETRAVMSKVSLFVLAVHLAAWAGAGCRPASDDGGGTGGASATGGSTSSGGAGGTGGRGPGGTGAGGSVMTGGAGGTTGGAASTGGAGGQGGATGGTGAGPDAAGQPDAAGGADAAPADAAPVPAGNPYVYVGSGFTGRDIQIFQLDLASGALAKKGTTAAGNPTYIAFHPNRRFLYAVDETGNRVTAFAINAQSGLLTQLNGQSSGGDGPAHLSVHRSGKWVLVANYNDGRIAVLPIDAQGMLGAAVDVQRPVTQHAHMITDDPTGAFVFVSATSPPNRVLQYRIDQAGKLTPNTPPFAEAAGQSPRHIAITGGPFAYAVGESGGSVVTFAYDPTKGLLSSARSMAVAGDGTHIAIEPAGRWLYASFRGGNRLVGFEAQDDGGLTRVAEVSAGLSRPWDFAIEPSGQYLLVANDGNDSVRVFRINRQSGALTPAGAGAQAPEPHFVGAVVPAP
jgi:6-phosphogluconolactonase